MCRGRRDAVVGLALVLLRASAKGLFDEITPAKPRVRSELVLPPPPPPPPALAVAAPLRPVPPSPWPRAHALEAGVLFRARRPPLLQGRPYLELVLLDGLAIKHVGGAPEQTAERSRP